MNPEATPDYAMLTDERIDRLRPTVAIQFNTPRLPNNPEVSWDGTRHFANGYGDGNPLWCDPEYGRKTRWDGLIAPPNFLYTMGENGAPPLSAEQKTIPKGAPLAGLGASQADTRVGVWAP